MALINFLSILLEKKNWFLSCEHQLEYVLSYFKNYTIRTESMPEYVCKLDVVGNLLPIKDRNDGEEKLRHIVNIQTKSIAKYVWKDFVDNFWTIKGRNVAKKTRKTKKKDECIFVVNTNTRRVHGCMAWSGCLVWKYALIHWKNRPCPHGLRLKELDQDYIYIRRRSWISDQIPWHSLKGIIIFLESAT